ncbi:MAG: glycosyltransferase family 2 protein [Spirochaetales bacterium]|nr:glycosyltransferase family 2 protein [Spirochaetales bacterium]
MNSSRPGISIVCVSYNGEQFISGALASLEREFSTSGLSYEYLIFDNASTDDSCSVIESFFSKQNLSGFIFKKSQVNLGFTKAVNILVSLARYDTLLFINNDTEILDLSETIDHVKTGKLRDDEILTGNILNKDLTPQRNYFFYPSLRVYIAELFLFKSFLEKYLYYRSLGKLKKPRFLKKVYFSGCFLVMKKSLFLTPGGFDETYVLYHEEGDLLYTLENEGLKKTILKDRIIHYGNGGNHISEFAFLHYFRGFYIFLRKHSKVPEILLRMLFFLGFTFRILLLRIGIRIHYSPFASFYPIYGKKMEMSTCIALHRRVLRAVWDE